MTERPIRSTRRAQATVVGVGILGAVGASVGLGAAQLLPAPAATSTQGDTAATSTWVTRDGEDDAVGRAPHLAPAKQASPSHATSSGS